MTFARAVSHVLKMEGGLVDNPLDPGGRTNRGITQRYLDASRKAHPDLNLPITVDDITDTSAAQLYSINEWEEIHGDALPDTVSFVLLDFAVNSGVGTAIQALQRALGITVDGRVGPQTIAACNRSGVVTALSVERLLYLTKLQGWSVFGKGWTKRVIDTAIEASS